MPRTSICTKSQPRRPILRKFRGTQKLPLDCLQVPKPHEGGGVGLAPPRCEACLGRGWEGWKGYESEKLCRFFFFNPTNEPQTPQKKTCRRPDRVNDQEGQVNGRVPGKKTRPRQNAPTARPHKRPEKSSKRQSSRKNNAISPTISRRAPAQHRRQEGTATKRLRATTQAWGGQPTKHPGNTPRRETSQAAAEN